MSYARLLLVLILLVCISGVSAAGVQFDQCANKNPTLNSCSWIGSILQTSNSQYKEGMSVPQRIVLTGIGSTPGNVHTLEFRHDATKSGIHAYDFVTSMNQGNTPPMILNSCAGLSGATMSACNTIYGSGYTYLVDVPNDPFISKDGSTQTRIDAYEALFGNRQIVVRANQPISAASVTMSHSVANGMDDSSEIAYVITWTSSANTVIVELGGHLAISGTTSMAWGPNLGASMISGGPYHFNLGYMDSSSLGSQDNQIMGSSIIGSATPTCLNPTYALAPGQQRTISFSEVFNLGTTPIATFTSTSSSQTAVTLTTDTQIDRITALSNGFTGSVTATVTIQSGATSTTCPVIFTNNEPTIACLDPSYPLADGAQKIVSFGNVFNLGTRLISEFTATSTSPATVAISTSVPTDEVRALSSGIVGSATGTVTITSIATGTATVCPVTYTNSEPPIVCLDPTFLLPDGTQTIFPFSNVFNLGTRTISEFTASSVSPPTVAISTFVSTNEVRAQSLGVTGTTSGTVTITSIATGTATVCPVTFTNVEPPIACMNPSFPLADGAQIIFPFSSVFNLGTRSISEFSSASTSPATVAISTSVPANEIRALSSGIIGSATGTVTITSTATGAATACQVTFTNTPGGLTCKTPSYNLVDGVPLTVPFSDVFNLGIQPITTYTATSTAAPEVLLTTSTPLDQITATASGLVGSTIATVSITDPLGTTTTCPITYLGAPISCTYPTYSLALGASMTVPFSSVFNLGGINIADYTATSNAPPTLLVSANPLTNQIVTQNQAVNGLDTATVTITHLVTGASLTCPIDYINGVQSLACLSPRYILRTGETITVPFTDVYSFGGVPLSKFSASATSPANVMLTANAAINEITATESGLVGDTTGQITLTALADPTQTKTCPMQFTRIPSNCESVICQACTDSVCLEANGCLDAELIVLNPSVAVVLSQLMPVSLQYSVASFMPLDTRFSITPPSGTVNQIFEIASDTTVPHTDWTAARLAVQIAGASNGPVRLCPVLRSWNFPVGQIVQNQNTPLLVTGSRAVSHYIEDTGTVKQAGPYIFTAKVWVRK